MKMVGNKEDSRNIGLSFFLLAGAIAGSIFCNQMTGTMKAELCIVGQTLITETVVARAELTFLLGNLFLRRLWVFGLILLMATTPYFYVLRILTAVYMGFSTAVLICPLTMEAGVFGLWKYLLLIFPQCLIYIPLGYLILWRMPGGRRHITWTAIAMMILGIFLGAAAESLINPWFLTFL